MARLHSVWGLAHVARRNAEARSSSAKSLAQLLGDKDASIRAAAVQGLSDAGLDAAQVRPYEAAIVKLLKDTEPRVQYCAAIASGRLQLASAFEPACELLAANADEDPALRHGAIMTLRGTPDATRLVQLSKHASRSVRLAAVVALRKRFDARVTEFLGDSDVAVQTEAARAINDVPELHAALASLASMKITDALPDPLLHRMLNAAFRLGRAEDAAMIASVAADKSQSDAMRKEAVEMLSSWAEPGELDRVMNRYLPLADRDAAPAKLALSKTLKQALDGSEEVRSAALTAAAELKIAEAAEALMQMAKNTDASTDSRVDALKSLLALDPKAAAGAVSELGKDKNPAVRAAALRGLVKLDKAAALPLLKQATKSDASVERQFAWDTLATVDGTEATEWIVSGLKDYKAGKLPADVWMNVLEASEGRLSREAQMDLENFEKELAEKDSLAPYRDCLEGGNVKAGERLFLTKTELSCVRCHRVGTKGGEVGPVLTDIGKTKDRRYLLEAIVNPDAKIAENFETAVILTEDDEVLTGIVKSETKDKVTLMTAEGKMLEIETDAITVRKKGKSSMPSDLIKHMSRRELRDLVAYLASLKKG